MHRLESREQYVRGHTGFVAMVRTSEPVAYKPRMRIARCSSPRLTPRWRRTCRHRTGQQPGCMRFLRSIYCHWCYARSGKRVLRWYSLPRTGRTSLGPRTWQSCWGHHPARSQSGRIRYLSSERFGVAPEPGVVESSCLAALRISEKLSALCSHVIDMPSEVRTPSMRRLYALKWGVFVKWCRMLISTRLLAWWRMFCVFYGTDWIVDLYHQHWKCMWPLLPRFVPRWTDNRSIGMRWWWFFLRERGDCKFPAPACSTALGPWSGIKSSFTAITRAFSIHWYEGIISQKSTSSCPSFG